MDHFSIPQENIRKFRSDHKAICIVGAGPAGLAALKVVRETAQYKLGLWKVTAFEAREKVGGVWDPALPVDEPPLTPLYDSLTTNIPHPIMAFTSYSFPPSTPVFPHASTVQKYLESYASHFDLSPLIQFNSTVTAVDYISQKWKVRLSSGECHDFDLVVICNGHYRIPRYPNVPGIAEWLNKGKASHSAWYRNPHKYGNKVLVVGGGPSGQDISAELSTVTQTVIHSVTGTTPEDVGNIKRRGRASKFLGNGNVVFEDGSTESDVDYCILATGYETSFPFFSDTTILASIPPPVPPIPAELYNSTYHVFPLAKHIFPLQTRFPAHTLAFIGLLVRVAPFPLVEVQARAAFHAFMHPEALDSTQEAVDIVTRHEELRARLGTDNPLSIAKAWHRFESHQQFEYRDQLSEFAEKGDENWELIRVKRWEIEMYERKDLLRKVWRELEASGEAEEWVKGVGEGGVHEWVELLEKMIKKGEEEKVQVNEVDKSKL